MTCPKRTHNPLVPGANPRWLTTLVSLRPDRTPWAILLPLIPAAKPGGHPRTADIRAVVKGIFYRVKTGGQWRWLPHAYPPWGTVAGYSRDWRRDDTWQAMHDAVREQVRVAAGREATPSTAIIDSQSVKTMEKGGAR